MAALRYAVRGWNGDQASPVADTRLALEQIAAKYPGVPIGLLGHSMGGRVALHLADDERITAIAALAPWVEPKDRARWHRGLHVLFMHGSLDRMTSPKASRAMADAMERLGADVTYESVTGESHAMLRQARRWHRESADFLAAHLLDQPCGTLSRHSVGRGLGRGPLLPEGDEMAEVVLFHHAQGLTTGIADFAETLRDAGHTVHTPDLYDGHTFETLDEGLAHMKEVGFQTDLDHALIWTTLPGGQLVLERLPPRIRPSERALRMGDDNREAALAQLVCGRRVCAVDPAERGLEQQPAPAGRALGDRLELVLGKPRHHVLVELPAAPDVDLDPSGGQLLGDLAHPFGQ